MANVTSSCDGDHKAFLTTETTERTERILGQLIGGFGSKKQFVGLTEEIMAFSNLFSSLYLPVSSSSQCSLCPQW